MIEKINMSGVGESARITAEAILEAARKVVTSAWPNSKAFVFFTAGTGVPDHLAVQYFSDTESVTVITRDGKMWRAGLCGGSPYKYKEHEEVMFMPKEAGGVGVAFFMDGHTEEIRSYNTFSDGDCVKFTTFSGEYWYEKYTENRSKFSRYSKTADEYKPAAIEKIVLFEE